VFLSGAASIEAYSGLSCLTRLDPFRSRIGACANGGSAAAFCR